MRTTHQNRNPRNQAIARSVADFLSEEWNHTPSPRHWAGIIDGPEGMRLVLGRDRVSGVLPDLHGCRLRDEESKRCTIGVTLTREPRAIAREIARRLLPGYMEVYREVAARVEEYCTAKERSEELAEKARRLIPQDLIPRIETASGGKVRVAVYLTGPQLEAVVQSLDRTLDPQRDAA